MLSPYDLDLFLRLFAATLFGWFIGLEREIIGKTAGTRTFALVSLGSTLFSIISSEGFLGAASQGVDPTRIASQILVGIGFIGAGVIIFREGRVEGLTTAATLWVTAAIGVTLGRGIYTLSIFTFLLTMLLLLATHWVHPEKWKKE